ncbi:hypothetical protein P22_2345 [Propionispora sp. 2/2-37]|uniref:glycosyltransferase n=1 Tax=Propionispora sp. 2/2-37 TaxID=1677858 RepID=UPI0006C29C62|nr:glycosyltransferase [Propionispora sp. 2/2-37]CUH96255.1 hypothetical protein P22_2345 [Propionispora sp. 2/2-37]
MMLTVSACVIAKNEEENIVRCLQSVKEIVEEMIVVDTGSTDDTVEIAREMGAKIFHYTWQNDFAAARNFALDKVKGDWIIFLDADEYILPSKIKNVRPFVENIHASLNVQSITCRMDNLEGVDGQVRTSNPTVRIFRNLQSIRYEGRIHESIFNSGKPVQTIMDDKRLIVICHTGYTKKTITAKIQRYAAQMEEELANGVVRDLTYYYLSDAYWILGQYEQAIEFAWHALEHKVANNPLAYKPYVILIHSMVQLRKYSEETIRAICEQAAENFPHHAEVTMYQALYYRSIGHYQLSLGLFLKSVEKSGNDSLNSDFYKLPSMEYPRALINIAQMYTMMNRPAQALEYYVKTLQLDKRNKAAFDGLISLIRKQAPVDIIYFLNTLYDIKNEEDIGFLVSRLSRLKVRTVVDYYHKIWYEKYGHNEFVGMILLLNEKFEKAFEIFTVSFQKSGDYGAQLFAVLAALISSNPGWVTAKAGLNFFKKN